MIVLATGTGRCGTKTFSKFFESQGWTSYHEREQKEMDREMMNALHSKKKARSLALKRYEKIKATNYFESNPRYLPLIKDFYIIDNNIKFIILIRDRDEVMNSWTLRHVYKRNRKIPKPPKAMKTYKDKLAWLLPSDSYIIVNLLELSFPEKLEEKLSNFIPIKKGIFDWSVKHNASNT